MDEDGDDAEEALPGHEYLYPVLVREPLCRALSQI